MSVGCARIVNIKAVQRMTFTQLQISVRRPEAQQDHLQMAERQPQAHRDHLQMAPHVLTLATIVTPSILLGIGMVQTILAKAMAP